MATQLSSYQKEEASININNSSMAASLMPVMIFQMTPTKKQRVASKMFPLSSNYTLVSCSAPSIGHEAVIRRSANYKPPIWDFDFIQSLSSEYADERYVTKACELKKQVKKIVEDGEDMLAVDRMELIDDLQKMGISHHFEDQINKVLASIYHTRYEESKQSTDEDLYSMALQFRLLRQHGFRVSQEIFNCFKNEKGDFVPHLAEDTEGLLQLYEASHLLTEGEETLEAAREFATFHLHKKLEEGIGMAENLCLLVQHALEMPLHWRVQRPNTRWFIDEYGRRPDMNPILLQFAKLDFNIVQATHQQELMHVSRWWKSTGLSEKLSFARDRLVECYFWNIGWLSGPHNGYSRITLAKVNSLITIIDDIFDVYGTLEELQLFHDVIQRWDIETMNKLPNYMQMCYLALDDLVNETAYDHVVKEQGLGIIPHLRQLWKDLAEVYLQEAKWYTKGYVPSFDEYINIAWISISGQLMTGYAFLLKPNPTHKEATQILLDHNDFIRWSGILFRLTNDLGTSEEEMERGDIPKSIQCYMNQSGSSKEKAEEHVRGLMRRAWKKMNEDLHQKDCVFSHKFVESAADLCRMSMYMYQHGDGHGNQNPQIKKRISSLLFEPFIM